MRLHLPLSLLLLGACAAPEFPDTAAAPGLVGPDGSAQCPDWRHARLAHPIDGLNPGDNPFPAHTVALGCSLDASIAAQLARPADMTSPTRRRAYGSGQEAVKTIETFRAEGPKELRERQSIDVSG